MKKIAFVVQRYGVEVNGGAEYLCRILAERLTDTYDVDVLTSCALEYVTWANWYPAETTGINGVRVHRFATQYERQVKVASRTEHKLKKWSRPEEWQGLGRLKMWARALVGKSIRRYSRLWAESQGPYTPDLLTYMKRHHQQYDVLIFITYLYYPTIAGINVAPQKSIFIPTAHDELPIYLPVFRPLFQKPRAILFLTSAEKRFVHQLFRNEAIYNDILGIGIETATGSNLIGSNQSVSALLGSEFPYLIYIGRIDPAKGCDVLFDYFIQFKAANPSPLKLVLVGQAFMPIPQHPDLVPVGFVEEGVKVALLTKAKALVIPSRYESLSMVTLESFAQGVPVIADQQCEVIKDHIEISQAGVLYTDFAGFVRAVQQILVQDSAEMASKGRSYVEQNYSWEQVLNRFTKAVQYVTGRNSH